jgi:hypothetical protein
MPPGLNGNIPKIVRDGIEALKILAAHEVRVRALLAGRVAAITETCKQIQTLADYKDIHDYLLSILQLQCYNQIVREIDHFPGEGAAVNSVREASRTLNKVIVNLRTVVARGRVDATRTKWIKCLDDARDNLRTALQKSDNGPLDDARSLIHQVLAVQPAHFNTLLKTTAHKVNFSDLANLMRAVCDELKELSKSVVLDADRLSKFDDSVDAMRSLGRIQTDLLDDHDRWQAYDAELRSIHPSVKQAPQKELKRSWPRLLELEQELGGERTRDLRQTLREEAELVEAAIKEQNPVKMLDTFENYFNQALRQFNLVDDRLKDHCEMLRKVGDSLESLI